MQATRRVYRRPTEFIGSQVGLRRLYRQPGGSTATVQATRKVYGDCTGNPGRSTAIIGGSTAST